MLVYKSTSNNWCKIIIKYFEPVIFFLQYFLSLPWFFYIKKKKILITLAGHTDRYNDQSQLILMTIRATYHFSIILLAITDLVVIIFIGTLSLTFDSEHYQRHQSQLTIRAVSITISCWMFILLPYERRYQSIVYPFS